MYLGAQKNQLNVSFDYPNMYYFHSPYLERSVGSQCSSAERHRKHISSVTSHINCIASRCLINIVFLTACAFIRHDDVALFE